MINIDNLTVAFSATPLFSGVSYVINEHDRVALAGKNGAGKSTMLKVICGEITPTEGNINIPKDVTIGYLPQVMKLSDDTTVREECAKAFHELFALKDKFESLEHEMNVRTDYESESFHELIEDYTNTEELYRMMGGEQYHGELERTLLGLGFSRNDLDRPTKEFSGGWRMRIELAKILLRKPDLLLLDEPTNHLDIESITWLEQFLANSKSAVMLISHDRAFINAVANRTIEITCGQIYDYKVAYNEYLVLRKERREQQLKAYENQQRVIAEAQDFINRFRYKPTKSNQVQSRVKMLKKMEIIQVDEEDTSSLRLKFPPASRSGDYPVICEDVSKSYGEQKIFSGVNMTIERGQKVAFVGKNGEGKSTLVKAILGEISYGGTLKIGHGIEIGYFAQNQAQLLDDNLSVYDTIDYVATGAIRTRIPALLGAFMFGGEASDKLVKVLSGGERTRLAMIKLLLEPANLLILDEPTNHLDLKSKDVLKEALLAFDGTVILVSHDRDFLDGLVDDLYEFTEGKVKRHIGGIYQFLQTKAAEQTGIQDLGTILHADKQLKDSFDGKLSTSPTGAGSKKQSNTSSEEIKKADLSKNTSSKESSAISYANQKEEQKRLRKLQKAVDRAEAQIAKREADIAAIEKQMLTQEGVNDPKIYKEHGDLKQQLEEDMQQWEKAVSNLEN